LWYNKGIKKGTENSATSAKESKLLQQKDIIAGLNEIICNENKLITSLRAFVDTCNTTIANQNEQVAYLTKKLFGISSEKSRDCAAGKRTGNSLVLVFLPC